MGFERDDDMVRAWYGGGYYEEPAPPGPPDGTSEGGAPAPTGPNWAREVWGEPKWPGTTPGDALVMGRFFPAHRGHAHLFARAAATVAGKVHVVVAGTRGDFIDLQTRLRAVTELVPFQRRGLIFPALDVGRQGEPDGDSFWTPWLEWLRARTQLTNLTTLVAGDPMAERFATLAGLQFVRVDRTTIGASGTAIRRAPWKYWNDITPTLRQAFTSSVALVGPEGAGKSTLARKLREHYGTSLANEYLADWVRDGRAEVPTQSDLSEPVWAGVRSAWASARAKAHRFFIADTDQLSLAVWSRRLYGLPIKKEPERPGLTLLLDDASPWLGRKDRDEPEQRAALVTEFRRLLTGRGWPFHVLDGPREGRFEQAVQHIDAWIRSNPMGH